MLVALIGAVASGAAALQAWRIADARAAAAARDELVAAASGEIDRFEPAMVDGLPDAARRFFRYTIAPGTPLHRVCEVRMSGQIGMGNRNAPGYQPMRARQLLAPPHGFVWSVASAGSGLVRMSGSDGMLRDRSWTRFWIDGLIPLRQGNDADHLRSSFGRMVAEAAFWAPAALLPQYGVTLEEAGPDRARAVVSLGELRQPLEISVADDGRPLSVSIPRWSNVNPERAWRVQPFGGTLADFRTFLGFTLPTRIDGGNHFGTADYFPFFRATVERVDFPARAAAAPLPA